MSLCIQYSSTVVTEFTVAFVTKREHASHLTSMQSHRQAQHWQGSDVPSLNTQYPANN